MTTTDTQRRRVRGKAGPKRSAQSQKVRNRRPRRKIPRARRNLKARQKLVSTGTGHPTRTGVDTGTMALARWSSLSPLAQMSLAFSVPGTINAPFVEANGTPSRVPTSLIHGEVEYQTQTTPADPNNYALPTEYNFWFNAPQLGYSEEKPGTGIMNGWRADNSIPISLGNNFGNSFSSVYGSNAVFSRYRILAQRLEFNFAAPEATLAGTVYIGSIQISAANGCNITSLIDNATESFPLKERTSWSLRTFLSDRSLVHENTNVVSLADEWVSYCVISKSPSVNIMDGTAANYRTYVKAHSNILWNPVVSSPVMNGISMRPPDSVEPPPKAQIEVANIIQSRASDPVPQSKSWLSRITGILAAGAGAASAFTPWMAPVHAALSAASAVLDDPIANLPDYSDRLSSLTELMRMLRNFPEGDESDESLFSELLQAGNRLYNFWESKQAAQADIRRSYNGTTPELHHGRRGISIRYRKPDGSYHDHRAPARQRSVGKKDTSDSSILRF